MPRFLADSRRVGWQGAYFTDVDVAAQGAVDHGHERYCVQRGMHREQRRPHGSRDWSDVGRGFSVWRAGDEQRFDWRLGGRSQFLFLSPQAASRVLGDTRVLAPLGHVQPQQSRVMALIFDALESDLALGSPAGPLVGESLIGALIAQLAGQAHAGVKQGAVRACDRAVEIIEVHFSRNLTLQELADATGLGVRQFCRAFRDATGHSPHQYLLRRRVEHAKTLTRRRLPLADVALQCGFADQSQLTRTFLRLVGTTPARYRADR
ncbi:MAG: helix-turn-helix transcriptional regulator [Rubrivivax sp.]|nr:helix-turn-helix transcriptional regulator [Rubrivivax sp.]